MDASQSPVSPDATTEPNTGLDWVALLAGLASILWIGAGAWAFLGEGELRRAGLLAWTGLSLLVGGMAGFIAGFRLAARP